MKAQTADGSVYSGRTPVSIARDLFGRNVDVVPYNWGWEVIGPDFTPVADLYRV